MGDKGDQLMNEGNKALNRTLIFGFGRQQKYEDAADNFNKAGNAYKLSNRWESAGNAFLKSAEAWLEAGDNKTDATNAIVEAGNCFKKVNPVEAIRSYQRAIGMFADNGRFGMCARYYKEIAEIFEADHNNSGAAEAYEQAAQMFERDNKKSNANTCMIKVATFVSEKGELSKAGSIFESIGKESLNSRLGAFSAKGYFLQALLCYLALGDEIQVRSKIDEYKNLDYSFGSARECEFIANLVDSLAAYDSEGFSQHCADFDRITPLDPWKTSMLLKAKAHIAAVDGSEEPDLS